MIQLPFVSGKIAAVMGLGKTGLSAVRALKAGGAEVWAWDDSEKSRAEAKAAGVPLVDLGGADLAKADLVIWSPGIPHTFPKPHPVAERARALGKVLISDIELLLRACPEASVVGITGTNGKSTTTALIAHVLRRAGRKTEVGGNLGYPALDLAPLGADGIYVIEFSSYQLELTPSLACDVAVLLNVTPDHLGRHGGFEGYVRAKKRIFDGQEPEGVAVIGIDDPASETIFQEIGRRGRQRTVAISADRAVAGGIHGEAGKLVDHTGRDAKIVCDLAEIPTLPGRHNWQNAAAALAAAKSLGLTVSEIVAGLQTYPGLAHRQELAATIGGVRYVNDSKATNADAAEKALVCYRPIYWIAGGQAKEGGIATLAPHFPRIRHAFLIGEAAPEFARTLEGKVAHSHAATLENAVRLAHDLAQREKLAGAVVLLSPACASWDQFKSFEHRGDVFRDMVAGLARKEAV